MKFEYDKLLEIYKRTGGSEDKLQSEFKDIINESDWGTPSWDSDEFTFYKLVQIPPKENRKRSRRKYIGVKIYKSGNFKIYLENMNANKEIVEKISEEISTFVYSMTKHGYIK